MVSSFQTIYKWCWLAFLAILPVAGTIALRNLLMLVLLVLLVFGLFTKFKDLKKNFTSSEHRTPWPLLIWAVFLCCFPLWALEPGVAWRSLGDDWGLSLIAWAIGIGTVFLLDKNQLSLESLAYASMGLVGVHLGLVFLAWSGLLGTTPPSVMSWTDMWHAFQPLLDPNAQASWHWQAFPWRFQGFDPMHGNLGYTATQAIALFAALFCVGLQRKNQQQLWRASVGTLLCFLSVVIAFSRGAILYSLLVLVLASCVYLLKRGHFSPSTGEKYSSKKMGGRRWIWFFLAGFLCLSFFLAIKKDPRWTMMADKVHASYLIDDPLSFLCEGLTPELEHKVRQQFSNHSQDYIDGLVQGLRGDGGRVLLMRASWKLVAQQPIGLDGSRHSFKKMMLAQCGDVPAIEFAHAHQAWVGIALSLGWTGAALFAALLLYMASYGWRSSTHESTRPWALALIFISGFWFLRGLTDAVFTEHYLLMQAVVMGYLWGRIRWWQ
jgi:O-Antigen ligase